MKIYKWAYISLLTISPISVTITLTFLTLYSTTKNDFTKTTEKLNADIKSLSNKKNKTWKRYSIKNKRT